MSLVKKLLLLVFLCITGICFSQYDGKIVIVEKVAKQRMVYMKGSEIKLKMKNGDKVQGIIFEISDSLLRVANKRIALEDVKIVYVERYWAKLAGNLFMIAGGGYVGIEALNNAIAGTSPLVGNDALIVGASMFSGGLLARCFITKKLHIGKWSIKVLDFS